jgi:hypothetical protein
MRTLEIIIAIVLFVMFSAVVVGAFAIYDYKFRECTNNPLIYGAKQLEDRTGYNFTGTGIFYVPIEEGGINPVIITFNSEKMSFRGSSNRMGKQHLDIFENWSNIIISED